MNINQMAAPHGATPITAKIIKESKSLECSCGGKMFEEKLIIKKVSPLLTSSGKEELFPMNILVCTSCGLVPKDLNPDGMIPDEFISKTKLDI